jgi:hypothetical protein
MKEVEDTVETGTARWGRTSLTAHSLSSLAFLFLSLSFFVSILPTLSLSQYLSILSLSSFSLSRFVIISKWKDQTALDQHFKTPHIKAFSKAMKGHSEIEQFRRFMDIPNLQYY